MARTYSTKAAYVKRNLFRPDFWNVVSFTLAGAFL